MRRKFWYIQEHLSNGENVKFYIDLCDTHGPRPINQALSAEDFLTLLEACRTVQIGNEDGTGSCQLKLDPDNPDMLARHAPSPLGMALQMRRSPRVIFLYLTSIYPCNELVDKLLAEPKAWNKNLFLPVGQLDFGEGRGATRAKNALLLHGASHVVNMLQIRRANGQYWLVSQEGLSVSHPMTSIEKSKRYRRYGVMMKGYGHGSHERTMEMLENLGIDPDTDLSNFPLDQLKY